MVAKAYSGVSVCETLDGLEMGLKGRAGFTAILCRIFRRQM